MNPQLNSKLSSILSKHSTINVAELSSEFSTVPRPQLAKEIYAWYLANKKQYSVLCSVATEIDNAVTIGYETFDKLETVFTQRERESIIACELAAIFRNTEEVEQVIKELQKKAINKSKKYKANTPKLNNNAVNSQEQEFPKKPTMTSSNKSQATKDQPKSQPPPLGMKTSHKKEQKSVPTSYNAARQDLEKKIEVSNRSEVEERRQKKLTIESDEQYYDKKTFEKVMDIEEVEQKAKQTDSSGKKSNERNTIEKMDVEKKVLKFQDEGDEDEEDIFAQMEKAKPASTAAKPQEVKAQPKSQEVQSKPKSVGGPMAKGNLFGWLGKNKA